MNEPLRYPRYATPQESGGKLIVPAVDEWSRLAAAASELRKKSPANILGTPLFHWATEARKEIVERAATYVRGYAGPDFSEDAASWCGDQPLVVAGHQPELFHPGVWLKNFVADRAAKKSGGLALNLVIDADLCRRTEISVPTGSLDDLWTEPVAFDEPESAIPWEERGVAAHDVWRSFPTRVVEAGAGLLQRPLVQACWPQALESAARTGRIGLALSQARHLMERQWGVRSLELPQSQVCQTRAFRQFAVHLIANAAKFASAYNSSLAEYRQRHKLRNHAQPVPDLACVDDWQELPFWLWSSSDPQRRPVFVQCENGAATISDRCGLEMRISHSDGGEHAIDVLAAWEADDGVKLRSRALTTTLFSRMALADLFVHGIGGARYDEATDAIARRFFASAPPMFAVVSGTLRLPLAAQDSGNGDVQTIRESLRSLEHHPENAFQTGRKATTEVAATAMAAKARWVATPKTHENAAGRHRGIVDANQRMRTELQTLRTELEEALAAARQRQRRQRVAASREYSFCLFSLELLTGFLLDS